MSSSFDAISTLSPVNAERGRVRLNAIFVALVTLITATSCRPVAPEQRAEPLPSIAVYELTGPRDSVGMTVTRRVDRDPLAALGATRPVTVTASNADARALLLWLAEQAGVSLIVAPDVRARVSVHFQDVPAAVAIRAIIAESGLSVLTAPLQPSWPPVVFHQLPVNINEASAEAIVARFGVSGEMARWIVETRTRP
jgi:hypothetical protein